MRNPAIGPLAVEVERGGIPIVPGDFICGMQQDGMGVSGNAEGSGHIQIAVFEVQVAEMTVSAAGLHRQLADRVGRAHDPFEVDRIAIVPPGVQGELIDAFFITVVGRVFDDIEIVVGQVELDGHSGQFVPHIAHDLAERGVLDLGIARPFLHHIHVVGDH